MIAVCVFLGSWNSGSSTLGEPYVAKWPDKYGNIKQRPVPRPDIVGKYYRVSNKIDTHNQLRQNELALEQLWRTFDPWFRLDTTLIGMTVTDAFQLARYAASDEAGIKNMNIREFALRTAYDLFHRKTSSEPFSEIILPGTSSQQQNDNNMNDSSPLTWEQAMLTHEFRPTKQRDGSGFLVRRACCMKQIGCHSKPGTKECSHPGCLAKIKAGSNRYGDTFGVFVCDNMLCRKKHWEEIAAQSLSRVEIEMGDEGYEMCLCW